MPNNLIIRNEQMKRMYLDGLFPVIYRQLCEMDALRKSRLDEKLPADDIPNPQVEIVQKKEITFIENTQELIRKDIYQAYEEGIKSKDGLLQYASYRFTSGINNWNKSPKMQTILNNSGISEADKLQKVYDILAGF